MIIKYSSLIGSLAAELKDQTRLGKVAEVVIDNQTLCLAAIVLKQPFLFYTKNKFVLPMDIVYLLKDGVIAKDLESLIDQNESVKIDKLVKAKSYGIGQKVVTDTGEQLGHVYDFVIDTESLSITKFYVKQLIHDRIIPIDKVMSMEARTITIKDNQIANKIQTVSIPERITAC